MFPGLPMQACGSWIVGLALVSIVQAHSPEPPNGTEMGTSAPGLVCTGWRGRGGYVLAGHTKVQVAGDLHLTRQHRPLLTLHGAPCYKQLSCEYPHHLGYLRPRWEKALTAPCPQKVWGSQVW